ncbi:hypothetical protein ACVWZV_009300 [Bradyrhizobium sp. GM5.1]
MSRLGCPLVTLIRTSELGKRIDIVKLAGLVSIAALRDENEQLKALLAQTQAALSEHQAALTTSEEARRRLEVILGELRREKFGATSEKLRPDLSITYRWKTWRSRKASWTRRRREPRL